MVVGKWRFGVIHQLIEEIDTRLKCNHPPNTHPHHHTPVSLLPSSSPTTRPPDSDESIHQPQRVKIYNPLSSSLEIV